MDAAGAAGVEDLMASASSSSEVMTAAEYSDQVSKWLQQAYHMQMLAVGFPSYLAYQSLLQQQQRGGSPSGTASSSQSSFVPPRNNIPAAATAAAQQQQQPAFREFLVAPLWKRFAAEFLDFLSLFVLKLVVTFVAVDTFELIDFENFISKYDSSLLSMVSGEAPVDVADVAAAFELTSEIVLLEMIHRVVVCAYETLCTYRGPMGVQGGATPGKLALGLRVLRCDQIGATGDPSRVRVYPASDLGFFWALLRAVLKNMSMAFLFPVSITFLFLPFNRTVYDVMSCSIVVEVPPSAARIRRNNNVRQQQQQR